MSTVRTERRGTENLGTWTFTGLSDMEFHQCSRCDVIFAVVETYFEQRRRDGKSFYCPNGHSFSYRGPTREESLRLKLERERDRTAFLTANLDQTKASLSATRGVVTKQKRKLAAVHAGDCPECGEHFEDLGEHMKQHEPDG